MGERDEVIALYGKVASARIESALIADAVMEASKAPALLSDREALVERLIDDDHAKVLRKEVTDVVMLVTAALEAPSVEVYRDFVAYVDRQAPLETFDEVTGVLREVLARKMAEDALDDVVENRSLVVGHLRVALQALGVPGDLPVFEAPAEAEGERRRRIADYLIMKVVYGAMEVNPATAGPDGETIMTRNQLPHINDVDACDMEDVKRSHLGADLEGVEDSDFCDD